MGGSVCENYMCTCLPPMDYHNNITNMCEGKSGLGSEPDQKEAMWMSSADWLTWHKVPNPVQRHQRSAFGLGGRVHI